MTVHASYRLLAALVTVSLIFMSTAGAYAPAAAPPLMARIDAARTAVVTPAATPDAVNGELPEDDDSGGWLGDLVDGVSDLADDVKDTTVDAAESSWESVKEVPGETWEVIESVPGTVWEFVEQIPGTITRLWEPVWEVMVTRFEIPGLAGFLADHPLLRMLLGPVLFLFGIAYDGTMSFLDAGIISLALLVPLIKTAPVVLVGIQKVLPWSSETRAVVTTIGRNPNGIVAGATNAFRLSRARPIAPSASSIRALPETPGVYVVLDASGQPLYVGMTNSLKRRLTEHYITRQSGFAERTASIKLLPTESTTAAHILECSLIKQLDPSDNILLKGAGACPIFLPASPKVFVTP